jgi:hypothetical protein
MSPRHRWSPNRDPCGAPWASAEIRRASRPARAGRSGRRARHQHRFDRHLDLEQHVVAEHPADLVHGGGQRLGERPDMAHRAGRPEGEQGQVQVARDADQEAGTGRRPRAHLGAQGVELGHGRAGGGRDAQVQRRAVEPVARPEANRGGLS